MPGTIHLDVLRDIHIASPCHAAWADMQGDHKRRHCSQCDLDVHNLAEMTRAEIEQLVEDHGGKLCCRIYKRTDGTILTKDCPVGLAALRAKTRRTAARVVAFASLLLSASVLYAQGREDAWQQGKLVRYQPFKWAYEKLAPVHPLAPLGGAIAIGKRCAPSTPQPITPPVIQ